MRQNITWNIKYKDAMAAQSWGVQGQRVKENEEWKFPIIWQPDPSLADIQQRCHTSRKFYVISLRPPKFSKQMKKNIGIY